MIKICFFSGNISNGGGTERVAIMIANALVTRGFKVDFLSYKEGEKTVFELNKEINLYSLHLEKYSGYISRKLMPYIKLIHFFKNKKYDIIINIDVLLCLYTLPLKGMIDGKIIAWEHFNFKNNNGTINRDKARILAGKLADYIIVLTQKDFEEYKKNLIIKNKIKKIYNPSIIRENINYNKENIVLASGRLTYAKNMEELIEIWSYIENKNKDWKLIICGEGESRESIQLLINQKKLNNVELMGFCNDIDKFYKKSKIFVMTSRYEGFPMVLLEAQSFGMPLIAYDCFTGPSEIINNNVNGFLIDYGDKEKFADKLNILMNSESLLLEQSKNAFIDSKRFSTDLIINEWIEVIKELIQK